MAQFCEFRCLLTTGSIHLNTNSDQKECNRGYFAAKLYSQVIILFISARARKTDSICQIMKFAVFIIKPDLFTFKIIWVFILQQQKSVCFLAHNFKFITILFVYCMKFAFFRLPFFCEKHQKLCTKPPKQKESYYYSNTLPFQRDSIYIPINI